jgi:hypothetical protein
MILPHYISPTASHAFYPIFLLPNVRSNHPGKTDLRKKKSHFGSFCSANGMMNQDEMDIPIVERGQEPI